MGLFLTARKQETEHPKPALMEQLIEEQSIGFLIWQIAIVGSLLVTVYLIYLLVRRFLRKRKL
jgi:hypothetical protein